MLRAITPQLPNTWQAALALCIRKKAFEKQEETIASLPFFRRIFTCLSGNLIKDPLKGISADGVALRYVQLYNDDDATITCLSTGAKYAGITCIGDATILLSGTNSVKGGMEESGYGCWPGIFVPAGKTLIIGQRLQQNNRNTSVSPYICIFINLY